MEQALYYIGIGFAALFTAKMIWLAYLGFTGKVDDDDGPVSGWGTPGAGNVGL